mmetsp:Transcript_29645/g.81574  ORF Transcript_29645/g.81574 Transcript_29645/m.81574 type:complete len:269 (+) Transcript_29645:194-1000(+)
MTTALGPAGRPSRQARTLSGEGAPAGRMQRPSAPRRSAACASVGVQTPAMPTRPRARARPSTAAEPCGLSTKRPPAAWASRTSPSPRTPLAPTATSAGSAAASSRRLAAAPRPPRGTAKARTPAATSASASGRASCGSTPSRTATTGLASRAASQHSREPTRGCGPQAGASSRAAPATSRKKTPSRNQLAACMALKKNSAQPEMWRLFSSSGSFSRMFLVRGRGKGVPALPETNPRKPSSSAQPWRATSNSNSRSLGTSMRISLMWPR